MSCERRVQTKLRWRPTCLRPTLLSQCIIKETNIDHKSLSFVGLEHVNLCCFNPQMWAEILNDVSVEEYFGQWSCWDCFRWKLFRSDDWLLLTMWHHRLWITFPHSSAVAASCSSGARWIPGTLGVRCECISVIPRAAHKHTFTHPFTARSYLDYPVHLL